MIEDVINEVRELFLDEGVDEQVLLELKTVTDRSIFAVPVTTALTHTCCAHAFCIVCYTEALTLPDGI